MTTAVDALGAALAVALALLFGFSTPPLRAFPMTAGKAKSQLGRRKGLVSERAKLKMASNKQTNKQTLNFQNAVAIKLN